MGAMSPLGEVLLATTTQFTAQCLSLPRPESVVPLPDPPPFGSFVKVTMSPGFNAPSNGGARDSAFDDPFAEPTTVPIISDNPAVLFGVVFHAETGAIEPGRPLSALGLTEDELLRDQPQLYELLATRFSAALIGWQDSAGKFRSGVPPRPPRPHSHACFCTEADLKVLGSELGWMRGIVKGERVPAGLADELTIAMLRRLWSVSPNPQSFPLRAGKELSRLLATDYERLRSLIESLAG